MLRRYVRALSLLMSVSFLLACSEPDDCDGRNNVRAGSFEISSSSPDQLSDLACAQVITGDLRIWKDVDSLANLGDLVHVFGDVSIESDQLESLRGLERLEEVGGSLQIQSSSRLNSIEPLATLQEVGRDLRLSSLPEVRSLEGLGALSSIGGDLEIVSLGSITDLAAFRSLRSVGGSVQVYDNGKLESAEFGAATAIIDQDKRYPEVGGSIEIWNNRSLKKLMGFGRQTGREEPCDFWKSPIADLDIGGNDSLEEISLDCSRNLCITIEDNPRLSSLSASPSGFYAGSLQLERLPQLSNVALPAAWLFHSLRIRETGLQTLAGFTSWSEFAVRCAAEIQGNPVLNDISQLRGQLDTRFNVVDNPALATCKVQALVEALPAPSGTYECGAYPATRQVTITGNDDATVCE